MKTLNITRGAILSTLAIAFILSATSCSKRKIEKSIAGVWSLEGISGQDMPAGYEMTGTFTFGDCTGDKDCNMSYDITFSYLGESENSQFSGPYSILKKGERLFMLDNEWVINITGNTMTLTMDDPEYTFSYNFTR